MVRHNCVIFEIKYFLAIKLIEYQSAKFRVVILSRIYLPFTLGLNIIKYVFNILDVCPFIVTNIIAKITV